MDNSFYLKNGSVLWNGAFTPLDMAVEDGHITALSRGHHNEKGLPEEMCIRDSDNIEQGGLTAAGRADNTDKLIFMNIHIHAVEGHHLTVAAVKLLDDVVDMYLYC